MTGPILAGLVLCWWPLLGSAQGFCLPQATSNFLYVNFGQFWQKGEKEPDMLTSPPLQYAAYCSYYSSMHTASACRKIHSLADCSSSQLSAWLSMYWSPCHCSWIEETWWSKLLCHVQNIFPFSNTTIPVQRLLKTSKLTKMLAEADW